MAHFDCYRPKYNFSASLLSNSRAPTIPPLRAKMAPKKKARQAENTDHETVVQHEAGETDEATLEAKTEPDAPPPKRSKGGKAAKGADSYGEDQTYENGVIRAVVVENFSARPPRASAGCACRGSRAPLPAQHGGPHTAARTPAPVPRATVCHNHLRVDLAPGTNFIVGKNGSGKSAIVMALQAGLGCKVAASGKNTRNAARPPPPAAAAPSHANTSRHITASPQLVQEPHQERFRRGDHQDPPGVELYHYATIRYFFTILHYTTLFYYESNPIHALFTPEAMPMGPATPSSSTSY